MKIRTVSDYNEEMKKYDKLVEKHEKLDSEGRVLPYSQRIAKKIDNLMNGLMEFNYRFGNRKRLED